MHQWAIVNPNPTQPNLPKTKFDHSHLAEIRLNIHFVSKGLPWAVCSPINVYLGFSIFLVFSQKGFFSLTFLYNVTYFGGGWLLFIMMIFQQKSVDTWSFWSWWQSVGIAFHLPLLQPLCPLLCQFLQTNHVSLFKVSSWHHLNWTVGTYFSFFHWQHGWYSMIWS